MTRSDIVLILLAVSLALIAVGIMMPDSQVGVIVNSAVDELVVLTTTEEHRLSQLEPETQAQVRALLQQLQNQGITVQVGQTLRSPAQEKAAIESGHSAVKTHSWHESGRAVDLYPIDPDTLQPDMAGKRDDLFVMMQQAAVSMGFHQIAYDDNWNRHYITNAQGKKIWDGGHIEWHGPFSNGTDAYNDYISNNQEPQTA
jgi:hypothetical protein